MGVLSRGNGRGIKTTVAKFLGTPSGANLLAALTTKTGTGVPVFSTNAVFTCPQELASMSATAATGTIQFDIKTQGVLYYTTNAVANFVLNFRGDSGTTLDSLMTTGNAISLVFMNTNGGTPYYLTSITIDGNPITPKYQGGTAITSGNASSIDSYTITLFKTGSATFTALVGQTKFA